MVTFTKYRPKIEKELHGVIEKELDALEEGLGLLKYEFGTGKGTPDFLCMDSGGRLLIIEVKLQEDGDILFQALRYYNDIDKDRYIIAKMFSDKKINPEEHPRIVLIAENFSDDIKRLSTLVVPDVELYEYTVLIGPNGKKGICYHSVSLPKIDESLSKPLSIEDHRNYLTKESLKTVLDKIREDIKNIGEGVEEYVTQSYIGFKFEGRQFAYIQPQRKSFDIGAHMIDDKRQLLDRYASIRIETGAEDYSEIFEKLKVSYKNLGGKLKEDFIA